MNWRLAIDHSENTTDILLRPQAKYVLIMTHERLVPARRMYERRGFFLCRLRLNYEYY
jgi:hypothetical protein